MQGASIGTSRPGGLRTAPPGVVRYLAFLMPLLGAAALGQDRPLFRSDEAVLAALAQSQSWSGGLSTLLGRFALALPLGDLSYRLAVPSMVGCGLLGLACFELAYSLFRAQGGYSRLDPWLAWGASMAGALSLPAATEGTVAGGATLAPSIGLLLCSQLISRKHPRGLLSTTGWGVTFGALLCESAYCALVLGLAALLLWPETKLRAVQLHHKRLPFEKAVVFVVSGVMTIALIALKNDWLSHTWSLTQQGSAHTTGLRPLLWLRALGVLWCLGAGLAFVFGLRDRRPLYIMCLLLTADFLLPSLSEVTWTGSLYSDLSRTGLLLFALGYVAAAGALGMRTFGETAQAIGLVGAKQLATLISIVAVAGSLAAAEDALTTLGQTEAQGAEAWSEEALQVVPARSMIITKSIVRGRRLRSAQLQGARPDVLVVPLSELTQARNVRRWLELEPELHLLLVDLSLGNPPSERAIARLVDARPVFVEPDKSWDTRLLDHIEPGLPLSRLSTHALARSDRLAALRRAPTQIDRIQSRAQSGMRPDQATLQLFLSDVTQLQETLALVDHVAGNHVAELYQATLPGDLDQVTEKTQSALASRSPKSK